MIILILVMILITLLDGWAQVEELAYMLILFLIHIFTTVYEAIRNLL